MKKIKGVMMMCFNAVIVNLKGKNDYRDLVKSLYYEFSHNKDGIFLYNSSTGNVVREVGNDTDYRRIIDNFDFSTNENSLIHMHLRLATRGKVNRDNVHGWSYTFNNETFLCSHNGSYNEDKYIIPPKYKGNEGEQKAVYENSPYSYTLDSWYYGSYYNRYLGDNSDSKEFFDKLFKKLQSEKKIDKLIRDLYGVAFCTSQNKILAISYKKSIKLQYHDNAIILSNEALYTDLVYNIYEYKFNIETPEIYNKMILIDIQKKEVKELYNFNHIEWWSK